MRRFAVLVMAGLLPLSLLSISPASASAGADTKATTPPPLAPLQPDALSDALEAGALSRAEYALQRARSIFALGAVRDEFGAVKRADPLSATLLLRDLALRLPALEGEGRALAVDILERPTQGGSSDTTLEYSVEEATPIETPNFRIHYVTSTSDQSTPAYAAEVALLMEEVWAKQVTAFGWVRPKADGTRGGGDDKFDVYLGNVGADMIYGYCSTDLGQTTTSQYSYCVLDNGFSEFPDPANAAKVTAAHEFNHALHFTYDVTDDFWFLEATATWMEDEVYDDINDNYQYLRSSSLGLPQIPADSWVEFTDPVAGGFSYGQFIWMKYLSETTGDASLIRRMWEATAQPGVYSVAAMQSVLGGSTAFANSFAGFATANTKPAAFYEEGADYEARVAPVRTKAHGVTPAVPVTGSLSNVDHLTSRYISFKPGSGVAAGEPLTIAVDVGTSPMQKATVVSFAGTAVDTEEIALTDGEGQVTVPFGSQSEVVLVLTNASNRMNNCSRSAPGSFSCGGTPADDNRSYTYSAVTGTSAVDPGEPTEGPTEQPVGPRVENFKATPSTITPTCKCRKAKARIFFDLYESATVTLALVRNGAVIGYFARNEALEGGFTYGPVVWDGRSPSGRLVKSGTYVVKLKAVGSGGTTTKKVSVTVRR